MIQDPQTTILGLGFLQTASEELICPREDLSVCRKDELKRLFTAHIPNVFKIICGQFCDILHLVSYVSKYSKCQFKISFIVYNYFSKGLDRDFKFNSYEYFIVQFIKLESYHQLLNGTQMYWRE